MAFALSGTGPPTVTTAPATGAVRLTVAEAAAATVTLVAVDVTDVPLESVTRAVRDTEPATVGVQSKE